MAREKWHETSLDTPAEKPNSQETATYHGLTMPKLTLNQAAKAAKKSKAALLESIRNGRLTAPKDDFGRYQIDPAELFRVYPPNQSEPSDKNQGRPQEEPRETTLLQANVEHLHELLRQIESERDDLRRRLDQSEEERRATQIKLTALLTDQRAKPEPSKTGFWQKLFGTG